MVSGVLSPRHSILASIVMRYLLFLVWGLNSHPFALADDQTVPPCVGVIGDSYSDEYQCYPPDRSQALNWVEILARSNRLNFGSWIETPAQPPANRGYEWNFAVSDITTHEVLESDRHLALARQIALGKVQYGVIMLGGNDFIRVLKRQPTEEAIAHAATRAAGNLRLILKTLLDANPRGICICTIPDLFETPEFAELARTGEIPPRLVALAQMHQARFNQEIRDIARGKPQIALVDYDLVTRLAFRPDPDHVLVLGQMLDRSRPRNHPNSLFLADRRHLGTRTQAEMANLILLAMNRQFQLDLQPLSRSEVDRLCQTPATTCPSPPIHALHRSQQGPR